MVVMAGIVWGWLLWLGLSGTGCHGWDCQGLLVMAGIVRDWLSWPGLSGTGCHGWDCQGARLSWMGLSGAGLSWMGLSGGWLSWLVLEELVVMDGIVRGLGNREF